MGPHIIAAQIWLIRWSEISCKCKNKSSLNLLIYLHWKNCQNFISKWSFELAHTSCRQWTMKGILTTYISTYSLYFIVNGQSSYVWVRYNFKWLTIVENIVSRKCGQIGKCDRISNKCTMKLGRIFQFRVGKKFNSTYLNIVYSQKTATNVRSFFYVGNIQFIC